jgi:hypothetical protein
MAPALIATKARKFFGPLACLLRVALSAGVLVWASAGVRAQGFDFPWNEPNPGPRPQQREPAYRPPADTVPPAAQTQPPPQAGAWGTKNPICLQLEQRLVQEGQRGNQSRSVLPQLEEQIRQIDQGYRRDNDQLERRCYEYFLFVKSLRGTAQCRDLARQVDATKRQLAELEAQRQDIIGSGGRTYQDDIINELARNNCGATYQQQARQRENSGGPNFWQDDSEGGPGGGGLGTYGNLGYATYRTLCVRLCDGYYFPISFSTLPNHFQRDQEACQSKCAAPVELYYYQNPGGAVDQMVAVNSQQAYAKLATAFRYRKEYVKGCSCKLAEYVPPPGTPQSTPGNPQGPPAPDKQGDAAPPPGAAPGPGNAAAAQTGDTGGWSAEAAPQ